MKMPYRQKRREEGDEEAPWEGRTRDPNWQQGEVVMLLEEMQMEKQLLLSAQCDDKTNKRKEETWERIADKITATFAVARRTALKCREKWGLLKSTANKQAKYEPLTAGGAVKQGLSEEVFHLVMLILGESSIIHGIKVEETECYKMEEEQLGLCSGDVVPSSAASSVYNLVTMPTCLSPNHNKDDLQQDTGYDGGLLEGTSDFHMGNSSSLSPAHSSFTYTPRMKEAKKPTLKKNFAFRRLPYPKRQLEHSVAPCASTPRDVMLSPIREDKALYNQYLRTQIEKNVKKSALLDKLTEKASLEITLLKAQLKEKGILEIPAENGDNHLYDDFHNY